MRAERAFYASQRTRGLRAARPGLLRLCSVGTPRAAEIRSAGPLDSARGRLPRAAVPTCALLERECHRLWWAEDS